MDINAWKVRWYDSKGGNKTLYESDAADKILRLYIRLKEEEEKSSNDSGEREDKSKASRGLRGATEQAVPTRRLRPRLRRVRHAPLVARFDAPSCLVHPPA